MRKFPIVLIVDDSHAFRVFFRDTLKRTVKWARIVEAKDGYEGLQMYLKHKPDVILLDLKMPNVDGFKVLKAIVKDNMNTRVVVTSAYVGDQTSINELMKMGAFSYLPKPMNRMVLMKTIVDVLNSGKKVDSKKKSPPDKRTSNSFVLNQNY
ncbi:hypothetical protein C6990_05860 [Nitrosopumilus sp. b3]|uniref:response regulator transcription factor n=1 Tax=Nitrosopumilus sp. b3 TaxID=2109909 RepID=UPI0015F4EDF6|nr:response regulator transcription factor [Nitrosopumilus sp. b3]KAF6247197.1 hypothetical protein C6990_05860 [Nitrosopumilus sp. b3]